MWEDLLPPLTWDRESYVDVILMAILENEWIKTKD